MSFHSLIQKVCLFSGSSVNTLISSVSEHPLTEQQWHFPSSHFPFYSSSLFAQETKWADSCGLLSAQVPRAGRWEPCWGLFCAGAASEVGIEILEGVKSSWHSVLEFHFTHIEQLSAPESPARDCSARPCLENSIWFSQHVLHGLFFLPNCSLWDKPARVKKGKILFLPWNTEAFIYVEIYHNTFTSL